MPEVDERTSGVVTVDILIDGTHISNDAAVHSIEVVHELNALPQATVMILDGDARSSTFAVSETKEFLPGREIEIRLGYDGTTTTVFAGVIMRHGVRVEASGGSFLVVDCSDKALALTASRSSRTFVNMTDSDVLIQIIEDAGLTAEVEPTTGVHEHILQAQSTDWDYLIARAEANGRVVVVADGAISVAKPRFDSSDLTVTFGASITEMDLTLDAVNQLESVSATSWNATDQQISTAAASKPAVNKQGNISGPRLSEVLDIKDFELQTARPLDDQGLSDWADAQLLKSRLSRIDGTISFAGNPEVATNTLLDVAGVGDRFNGNGYVSGVRHVVKGGTWDTQASFGLKRRWNTDTNRHVIAPPAAGLTPGISGLQIAKVIEVHDPDSAGRVKVSLPLCSPDTGVWVRMATPYAGDQAGISFRPEIDDEVVVGFLNDDPNAPVILGAMHSHTRQSPVAVDDQNTKKAIVTKQQLTIEFDDDTKTITLRTPAGQSVALNDDAQTITLADASDNSVTMSGSGIELKTPQDLTISADGTITLEGSDIKLTAASQLTLEGSAGASLTSSAATSVEGSIVTIN